MNVPFFDLDADILDLKPVLDEALMSMPSTRTALEKFRRMAETAPNAVPVPKAPTRIIGRSRIVHRG